MVPSSQEVQHLVPVLNFFAQFAMQSDSTCQTVLDAGVLTTILRIYVVFPIFSGSTREDFDRKVALRDACRLTLRILGQSRHHEAVFNHPVCIFWADCNYQPPAYTIDAPIDPVQDRWVAWRRTEKSCVKRRVIAIYRHSLWSAGSNMNVEACIDLVGFCR